MDKYIVLTRPEGMNSFLVEKLKQSRKLVYELPSIRIDTNHLSLEEIKSLKDITSFSWIIFTSANGVNAFMEKLHELRINIDNLKSIKIGVIGPATAKAVEEYGLAVTFQPSVYISTQIPKEIDEITGERILLPRADIASKDLQYTLEAKGAIVINIPIYKTIYDLGIDHNFTKLVEEDKIAYITFTSSSTVKGFMKRIEPQVKMQILSLPVICIGPITASTARSMGFHNITIAKEYTMEGIWNILHNRING